MRSRASSSQTAALFLALFSSNLCADWVRTNGPFGGSIISVAASGNMVFAATYDAGVFRSLDNGATWNHADSGLIGGVRTLAAIAGNLYAGTAGGVYVSRDLGVHWTAVDSGMKNMTVSSIGSFQGNPCAGTNEGTFLSTNEGASWKKIGSQTMVNALAFRDAGEIFSGTNGGLYRSKDSGSNWTKLEKGLTSNAVNSVAITATTILAGTSNGVFVSTNNGSTWAPATSGIPSTAGVYALTQDDSLLYAGTNLGCFVSSNNGLDWSLATTNPKRARFNSFSFGQGGLFAGTDEGLLRSQDHGAHWAPSNSGLTGLTVNSLTVAGKVVIAGTDAGIFRTYDDGTTWTPVNAGLPAFDIIAMAMSGSDLYAQVWMKGLFHSSDTGTTWSEIADFSSVYSILADDNNLVVGYGNSVYQSGNKGSDWTNTSQNLMKSPSCGIAARGKSLLVATNEDGVYLNDGTSWKASNAGLPPILTIYSLADNGSTIFLGTGCLGIYASDDFGSSWIPLTTGYPMSAIVFTLAAKGQLVFAGTNSGIFASKDNGSTWKEFDQGFVSYPGPVIVGVANNSLFAGKNGGVWRRPLSDLTGSAVQPRPQQSKQPSLSLHASPSHPSVAIEFDLPQPSNVTISAYDLSGRKFTIVDNARFEAGPHRIDWNPRPGSNALYTIRLQVDESHFERSIRIFR